MTKRKQETKNKRVPELDLPMYGPCPLEPTQENMDSLFRSWKATSALQMEGDAQGLEQQAEIADLRSKNHQLACQAKANRKKMNIQHEAESNLLGEINSLRVDCASLTSELKEAKDNLVDLEDRVADAEDIANEFKNSPEGQYKKQRDEMMEELDNVLHSRMKDLRQTKWLLEQCIEEGSGEATSRIVDFLLKLTFELGRYECWLDHVVSQDFEKRGLATWYKLGLRSPISNI